MLLGSILAGMIWGLIPAYFKAKYNTNETLFTLMMNYVAMQLVNYAICFWENPKGSNTVGIINKKTNFGWFPSIAGNPYILNVLIVLAVTLLMSWYLRPAPSADWRAPSSSAGPATLSPPARPTAADSRRSSSPGCPDLTRCSC